MIEPDPEIDFRGVLLDLVRMGWRLRHVAIAINVPPSTLQGWWTEGAHPLFEHGRALLKLHEQELKKNGLPNH